MKIPGYLKKTALLVSILLVPQMGGSCGPFFPKVVFIRPSAPELPLSKFADGRLGIVHSTWPRAYLAVAFRFLDGKPLTKAERLSFLTLWETSSPDAPAKESAEERWSKARSKYRAQPPHKTPWRYRRIVGSVFAAFDNCLSPAFNHAIQTLEARAKLFGAGSRELQEWISGQDAVFNNCNGGRTLPASLPADAPPLLKFDRAYQTAAAHFYAAEFDTAEQMFGRIAHADSSPWRRIAPYLQARAVLRKSAFLAPVGSALEPGTAQRAEQLLRAITLDPDQKEFHEDAQRLLAYIEFRTRPGQRQRALAGMLRRNSGSEFGQYLRDYTFLLNRFLDDVPEIEGTNTWEEKYQRSIAEWKRKQFVETKKQRTDALTDWLITMQSETAEARAHAVARWRSTRSIPWLVAALGKVNAQDEAMENLLEAASTVQAESAAFATVTFHRIRLARERGDHSLARELIHAIGTRDSLPTGTWNAFLTEHLKSAPTLEDLVGLLAKTPIGFDGEFDTAGGESFCQEPYCDKVFFASSPAKKRAILQQFDGDGAAILNIRLPLRMLVQVAGTPTLPDHLRKRLTLAVWARSALLDDMEAAAAVERTAIEAEPQLAPYMAAHRTAKSAEERKFAAVFAILHFPGLRPFVDGPSPRATAFDKIDDYRDNWWCEDVGRLNEMVNYEKRDGIDPSELSRAAIRVPGPIFLKDEEIITAESEWRKLSAIGAAPAFLTEIVLERAKNNPSDPRLPEALHLAVKAGRFGCKDGKTKVESGRAFKLLHSRFPRSAWAKKTPFWK